MWIGRFRRGLEELRQEIARAARDEERATFELTRSARAFSHRTREAADDKLAFSATLMRAGEVGAAERLIHDLEQDVRGEQAALTQRVDAVEAVAATRRAKMTRLRLARTLAAAVLTAGLLSFSVAGIAVASFLADLGDHSGEGSAHTDSRTAQGADSSRRGSATRSIRLPDGTSVMLTQDQFRRLKSLSANPNLGPEELERLLIDLLGPKVAGQLSDALAGVTNGATQAAGVIGSRAGQVESKVEGIESPSDDEPSSGVTSSDDHEQTEAPAHSPEKPDDEDIIDTPLGSKPKTPVPNVGGD